MDVEREWEWACVWVWDRTARPETSGSLTSSSTVSRDADADADNDIMPRAEPGREGIEGGADIPAAPETPRLGEPLRLP
jgi:hypothetical protein